MSIKEVAAGLGGLLLTLAFMAAFGVIVALFIYGAGWASTKLLPWFSILTWVALATVVFVLLPLSIPRATRGFSSVAIFIASYVFGVTLWMMGLLLTLSIWGVTAVIIGIVLGGVGVVPIAMLATLFHGYWLPLVELILLTIATFGCRIGALSLAQSLEQESYA
jgi:hypothetical protein